MDFKINYLKKFPEIKSKRGRNYYFFRGFLWCLSPEETCKVLDLRFEQDKFKMDFIIEKILRDMKIQLLREHIELSNKLLKTMDGLNPYYRKERCARYLTSMFTLLPTDYQRKLINHFLKSKYRNNRKRAYGLLLKTWKKGHDKILINSWRKLEDVEALRKFIEKFPERMLEKKDLEVLLRRWHDFSCAEELEEDLEIIIGKFPQKMFRKEDIELITNKFQEEYFKDEWLYFPIKILRNNLYAKLCTKILKYSPNSINSLKKSDPISYIHIIKECLIKHW